LPRPPNVNRINLAPLTDAETGQLVSALLGAVVPPELQAPILDRAEGNPLYAEEFVRLLRDRDLLIEADGTVSLRPSAEVPLPESIGALIAARLDTLPAERKAMLSDAAVVGKVFWAGAVAAMGGRDTVAVTEAMRELARKELVRPARHSSMGGEAEYAFWHVLTRDVAYAQLPRPSRATRHVAAAEWLEAKAGQRVEDIAEVVAYHYATALDLDRAAGLVELASALEPRALRYLTLAGEKAMTLDIAAAEVAFKRALVLAPEGHPSRAQILVFLANVERTGGNIAEAIALLREGIAAYTSLGDRKAADEAIIRLDGVLHASGDPLAGSQIDEIIRRLQPAGPSELLAHAYSTKQFYDHSQPWADRALAIAEVLDLPMVRQHALNMRGLRRANGGDPGGIDDLRAALALAMDQLETERRRPCVQPILGTQLAGPLAALDESRAGRHLRSFGAAAGGRSPDR
jgi:tetratricopeptide (TPR) repeat protein